MLIFGRIQSRTARRCMAGVATTALAMVLAAPAMAQDTQIAAPQDTQATPIGAGEDIVVTGSRVSRSGYQSPTPLTVLSAEEIQNQSPSNNIADYLNQQPALAGSTRPSNSRLNLSSGQAGINALNLRNLGENRTLILLDGRRSVASTITGLVDVNTIPQSLVKSVEIVTGGASAAYGSDAVAGVVNFILDKKYEGLKLTADSGVTTYGDGGNYSFSAAAGKAFAGGRGHILLSAELAHRDGIFEIDRDWNATGYVRFTNPAWTAGDATAPRYLTTLRQVGAANSTPGGLITGQALRGYYFGQGGQVLQYHFGNPTYPDPSGAAGPSLTQGGDWQVNDSGRRIGLDPQDDRHGVFGRLSYDITNNVELFAEGSYNYQHILFNAGPNLSTGIGIKADNAYLINQLGAAGIAVPAGGVTLATTAADLPYRATDNRRKVQRYVLGADGHFQAFGKEASWDVYAQYGRADLREQLRNVMNISRMNNATDAVFAPAGNALGVAAGTIVCRSSLNDPTNGCVPLNRMGIGVADPAAINYVLGDPYRDETIEEKAAGYNVRFTPFATWAGDVSVAFGGEWREESISGYVPQEYQPVVTVDDQGLPHSSNAWSVGNYLPTNGKFNVKEEYLEVVVPLGLGIEFNGAARATDYSTAGYVTTWKAGATWQPIPDIRFRVVRSRDIRAPNLNELYQAGSANSDSVSNPAYTTDGKNGPASFGYSGNSTGNLNLRPEIADSLTIGAVLSPRFLPGFNASIDYWRISMKDAITTFSAQTIINLCYIGQQQYCNAYSVDPARTTDPQQPYLVFQTQPFNAASQLVRGIDFDVSYRLPVTSQSSVTLRGTATRYLDNITDTGVEDAVIVNQVGVNGGQYSTPNWIFHASVTYDLPRTSITLVGRGISAGKYAATGIECQSACPVSTTNYPTYDNNHVSGLFYTDLNLTQKVAVNGKSDAQFFLNVTNLFNRAPLLVPETGLAANSTYSDLLGRTFRVGVRFQLR